MEHLPISYYRIGQPIFVDDVVTVRTEIAELTRLHIGYYFGQEREGLRYTRTVSPESVKPILRPFSQIRISHVLELVRQNIPGTELDDDQIATWMSRRPELLSVYAETPESMMWLLSLNYDMFGLISKGLAIADE